MFKLLARHLCPAVLPLASLSSTAPSSPQHHARGDIDLEDNGVGAGVSNVASRASTRESPLTFGKVFTAIPRVTAINTPNINRRISQVWGLPALESSTEFKKIYASGRDELRSVQFVYKCQWKNLSDSNKKGFRHCGRLHILFRLSLLMLFRFKNKVPSYFVGFE